MTFAKDSWGYDFGGAFSGPPLCESGAPGLYKAAESSMSSFNRAHK